MRRHPLELGGHRVQEFAELEVLGVEALDRQVLIIPLNLRS